MAASAVEDVEASEEAEEAVPQWTQAMVSIPQAVITTESLSGAVLYSKPKVRILLSLRCVGVRLYCV